MSYGGQSGEHVPARREIADVKSWEGPSAAERDLTDMFDMLPSVGEVLQTRTNHPDEQTPTDQATLLENSLWVLQRLRVCVELFIEHPVNRATNFAEMTYLAANSLREEFQKELQDGHIDQRTYERVEYSLGRAAHDICNAFDFASLLHNLPRQREATGDVPALGEIALGPGPAEDQPDETTPN